MTDHEIINKNKCITVNDFKRVIISLKYKYKDNSNFLFEKINEECLKNSYSFKYDGESFLFYLNEVFVFQIDYVTENT